MREAGVLAGGAEEAAAHRLRELVVGRELDSELVARAGTALGVQQVLGDVAGRHVRGGERIARLGAMTALRALAEKFPVLVGRFEQTHGDVYKRQRHRR